MKASANQSDHLQGLWKSKFDSRNTVMEEFHVPESTMSREVPMMYQDDRFRYGSYIKDSVEVLEMPYKGDDISMVLVLPSEGTLLETVEQSLSLKKLTEWLDNLRELQLNVYVPRFRIEDSISLKQNLEKMGLKDLFNPHTARLPGQSFLIFTCRIQKVRQQFC